MAKIRVKQGDNEIEIDSRDFYVDNDSAAEIIDALKQQLQKTPKNDHLFNLDPSYGVLTSDRTQM